MFDCSSIVYGWLIPETMHFLKKSLLKENIIKHSKNSSLMKYYKYLLNKNTQNSWIHATLISYWNCIISLSFQMIIISVKYKYLPIKNGHNS